MEEDKNRGCNGSHSWKIWQTWLACGMSLVNWPAFPSPESRKPLPNQIKAA